MGRKKKYMNDEEKVSARRERQMKYYWRDREKNLDLYSKKIISSKDAVKLVKNPDMPSNWLEIVLGILDVKIKLQSQELGNRSVLWDLRFGFNKEGENHCRYITIACWHPEFNILVDVLRNRGYEVELTNDSNWLNIAW